MASLVATIAIVRRKSQKIKTVTVLGEEEMGQNEEDDQAWVASQCRGNFVGGYRRCW